MQEGVNVVDELSQWKENGFLISDTTFSTDTNSIEEFREVESAKLDFGGNDWLEDCEIIHKIWYQEHQYVLVLYQNTQEKKYTLVKMKPGQTEGECIEIPILDEMRFGYVACIDVISDSHIALLYVEEYPEGEMKSAKVIHINENGETLLQTEITENYAQEGILCEDLIQGKWWCDTAYNSYVVMNDGRKIMVFEATGEVKKRQQWESGESLIKGFHSPEGEVIFVLNNLEQNKTRLVWLDEDKKEIKELAELRKGDLYDITMHENGMVYFIYQNRLWEWNVIEGKCKLLFNTLGSSIPNDEINKRIIHIALLDSKTIYVIIEEGADIRYCKLSREVVDEGIVIADYAGLSYVKQSVIDYNKMYQGIDIQYSRLSSSDEDWVRTMAELSSGKGPDMLCLFSADERVRILFEKGVLMDLDNMIADDTKEQIFSGIIDAGSIEGHLIGICPQAIPIVMVTSDKLWEKEQWTNRDIIEIVEANPELEGLYVSGGKQSSAYNLSFMTMNHINNSPYIDWNKGISKFQSDDFIRSLEISKYYGELPGCSNYETKEKIRDGKILATLEYIFYPSDFVELKENYGEHCHVIGWPGQTGYVGYWSSTYLILVNKETEYKNEIADFLEFVLCEENQKKVNNICVREDVIRESVYYDEITEEWYIECSDGVVEFDGDRVEEYINFLDALGPWPADSIIGVIVGEEAESYFNSSKKAEDVARIIDSRVQLYLDEQ